MSASIMRVVKSTPAVEYGFLAAGVTISISAAIESVIIVLGWLG